MDHLDPLHTEVVRIVEAALRDAGIEVMAVADDSDLASVIDGIDR